MEPILKSSSASRIRFGTFELNLNSRELRSEKRTIRLQDQAYRLLRLLLERWPEAVSRKEIKNELWPNDTFVDSDHGINTLIKTLRGILGDSPDQPSYIQTLPKLGYRMLAAPEWLPSALPEGPANRVAVNPENDKVASSSAVVSQSQQAEAIRTDVRDLKPEMESPSGSAVAVRPGNLPYLAVLVLLVAILVAGGLYYRSHRSKPLTDKDTIVVSDFTNGTADPVFDDTLKQGLAVQLEQSPFLALVPDSKVTRTLKLMNHPVGDKLTPEVTREVCQRVGGTVMVAGSIAQLGSQYVIGLEALNCSTGDVLGDTQEQAGNKEVVLNALDRAAVRLRSKLGESLSSVQRYATPLEDATTPSLEALKAYSLARKERLAEGDAASLKFYNRAIELDPNFAIAYQGRSAAYRNVHELERARVDARKAYDLRRTASDRERFTIEAAYYLIWTGELEKASQTYELWEQTYPRDYVPYTNLGFIYVSLGNLEKALEEAREAMRLQPKDGGSYSNLGGGYQNLNRLDEAEAVYRQALESKIEGPYLLTNLYSLGFLRGDEATMAQSVAAAMGKSGVEDLLLAAQADTEAWHGRLKSARRFTRQAMDSALPNEAKETAAAYQALAALREVEAGNRNQAVTDARAAIELGPNRDVRAMAALAMARAGDTAGAEKVAAELGRTFPLDTLVQRYWLPTIRAALALERKDANKAIDELRIASPLDLSEPAGVTIYLCPSYLRGQAYLMLRDGSAARAEFQRFIDHYGLVGNFPWGALSRLGLARSYAMQGDTAKAKVAYRDFLTLWNDADPDIPIYKQAKSEYARLKSP
jgi:DNA-binding winged helix-turn-helix (wHTH) protein/tetratricopeptide (TPR) repeat protein